MKCHLVIFLGLVFSINCFPQLRENHLVAKYTQNNGLSSFNIRSIVQDPMGFTWVATQDGLNLFDGSVFTKYTYNNTNATKKILANDVRALVLDSLNHSVWALTSMGGINEIDYFTGEVIKSIKIKHLDNDDWSISMVLVKNQLWLGCMNSVKVYDIVSNKLVPAPAIPFKKNSNDDLFSIKTMCVDKKSGNIWAFLDYYGILIIGAQKNKVIDKIDIKQLFPEDQSPDLKFVSVLNSGLDSMVIGTTHGIKSVSYYNNNFAVGNVFKHIQQPPVFNKIAALASRGNILYISDNSHLYKFNQTLNTYKIISETSGAGADNWLSDIQCMYIDSTGNIWMGCKQGLAFLSLHQSPFKSFNNKIYSRSGLTHLYNVFPTVNGDLIIGQENGLLKYKAGTDSFLTIEKSKPFNFSFIDFKKNTVVSAGDGLFILKGSKLIPIADIYPELKQVSKCYINSSIAFGDSLCVLGSDNNRGIFLWNYKRRQLKVINNSSYPIKLRSNIINKIFKDDYGRVWILSDHGVDLISNNFTVVNYLNIVNPRTRDTLKLFFDICQAGNHFWLTSYGAGIVETDSNGKPLKFLNTGNGLCNDGVYGIFNTGNKNLVITSNNGLAVLNTTNDVFVNYYEQDGLHSNAFEENCGIVKDGKIYAGGLNGFTIIDPDLFFTNKIAPKLYFGTIKIDTKTNSINIKNLNISNVTIPNNVLQTTIWFSGLNYSNPNRVSYKYKIEELNNKWVDLGTQNFVNIIGLNPGNYTLLVKSANEDGIWNKIPVKLTLQLLPKWYQTWWFKLAIASLVCLILHGVYLYRVKQLKVQQQIRRHIANDLHDDLGSSLNSIKMFTHLAISEKQNASYLTEIETLITQTAAGLRDMLWVLEDSRDNLGELMARIKKFALPIAEANKINLQCDVDDAISNQNISKTEKRNLLLIAKEALNNSFKYSHCNNIQIWFKADNKKKLQVTITDDGLGFDTTAQTAGYGLNNLKYRAEQINYRCQISSSPNNGTVLTMEKT
jgi:ligand-binding sensor domain-containing protein